MKRHPRSVPVAEASAQFQLLVAEFLGNHEDLTSVEILQMLNAEIATSLKYALRKERHNCTDYPAEWTKDE